MRDDVLVCTPAGQERTDAARSRALASTILVGTGVALVATGAVLYLTAPADDRRQASARLAPRLEPVLTPDGLGIQVTGSF